MRERRDLNRASSTSAKRTAFKIPNDPPDHRLMAPEISIDEWPQL
jgi:hypothetical protein